LYDQNTIMHNIIKSKLWFFENKIYYN
jgi:hypothetical protein